MADINNDETLKITKAQPQDEGQQPEGTTEAEKDDVEFVVDVPEEQEQDEEEPQTDPREERRKEAAKARRARIEANAAQLEKDMKDQAREDERPQSSNLSLRKILGGNWLTTEFLKRQIGVILVATGIMIVYISNRYSCQKEMLEIDRLNSELEDAKYRALSTTSELTEKCRESNVMEMLRDNKDSILKISSQPPYIINVPDNHRPLTK